MSKQGSSNKLADGLGLEDYNEIGPAQAPAKTPMLSTKRRQQLRTRVPSQARYEELLKQKSPSVPWTADDPLTIESALVRLKPYLCADLPEVEAALDELLYSTIPKYRPDINAAVCFVCDGLERDAAAAGAHNYTNNANKSNGDDEDDAAAPLTKVDGMALFVYTIELYDAQLLWKHVGDLDRDELYCVLEKSLQQKELDVLIKLQHYYNPSDGDGYRQTFHKIWDDIAFERRDEADPERSMSDDAIRSEVGRMRSSRMSREGAKDVLKALRDQEVTAEMFLRADDKWMEAVERKLKSSDRERLRRLQKMFIWKAQSGQRVNLGDYGAGTSVRNQLYAGMNRALRELEGAYMEEANFIRALSSRAAADTRTNAAEDDAHGDDGDGPDKKDEHRFSQGGGGGRHARRKSQFHNNSPKKSTVVDEAQTSLADEAFRVAEKKKLALAQFSVWEELFFLVTEALDKLPKDEAHTTVYRGINIEFPEKQFSAGKYFAWPAFSSTSGTRSEALKFSSGGSGGSGGTLFVITGQWNGCDVHLFSRFPEEDEVLLPPQSYFKVTYRTTEMENIVNRSGPIITVQQVRLDAADEHIGDYPNARMVWITKCNAAQEVPFAYFETLLMDGQLGPTYDVARRLWSDFKYGCSVSDRHKAMYESLTACFTDDTGNAVPLSKFAAVATGSSLTAPQLEYLQREGDGLIRFEDVPGSKHQGTVSVQCHVPSVDVDKLGARPSSSVSSRRRGDAPSDEGTAVVAIGEVARSPTKPDSDDGRQQLAPRSYDTQPGATATAPGTVAAGLATVARGYDKRVVVVRWANGYTTVMRQRYDYDDYLAVLLREKRRELDTTVLASSNPYYLVDGHTSRSFLSIGVDAVAPSSTADVSLRSIPRVPSIMYSVGSHITVLAQSSAHERYFFTVDKLNATTPMPLVPVPASKAARCTHLLRSSAHSENNQFFLHLDNELADITDANRHSANGDPHAASAASASSAKSVMYVLCFVWDRRTNASAGHLSVAIVPLPTPRAEMSVFRLYQERGHRWRERCVLPMFFSDELKKYMPPMLRIPRSPTSLAASSDVVVAGMSCGGIPLTSTNASVVARGLAFLNVVEKQVTGEHLLLCADAATGVVSRVPRHTASLESFLPYPNLFLLGVFWSHWVVGALLIAFSLASMFLEASYAFLYSNPIVHSTIYLTVVLSGLSVLYTLKIRKMILLDVAEQAPESTFRGGRTITNVLLIGLYVLFIYLLSANLTTQMPTHDDKILRSFMFSLTLGYMMIALITLNIIAVVLLLLVSNQVMFDRAKNLEDEISALPVSDFIDTKPFCIRYLDTYNAVKKMRDRWKAPMQMAFVGLVICFSCIIFSGVIIFYKIGWEFFVNPLDVRFLVALSAVIGSAAWVVGYLSRRWEPFEQLYLSALAQRFRAVSASEDVGEENFLAMANLISNHKIYWPVNTIGSTTSISQWSMYGAILLTHGFVLLTFLATVSTPPCTVSVPSPSMVEVFSIGLPRHGDAPRRVTDGHIRINNYRIMAGYPYREKYSPYSCRIVGCERVYQAGNPFRWIPTTDVETCRQMYSLVNDTSYPEYPYTNYHVVLNTTNDVWRYAQEWVAWNQVLTIQIACTTQMGPEEVHRMCLMTDSLIFFHTDSHSVHLDPNGGRPIGSAKTFEDDFGD
eukprot:PhM_4_TR13943/c0_g1_i5/m.100696